MIRYSTTGYPSLSGVPFFITLSVLNFSASPLSSLPPLHARSPYLATVVMQLIYKLDTFTQTQREAFNFHTNTEMQRERCVQTKRAVNYRLGLLA